MVMLLMLKHSQLIGPNTLSILTTTPMKVLDTQLDHSSQYNSILKQMEVLGIHVIFLTCSCMMLPNTNICQT